jgi:phospholipase/carboxylesterase
MIILAIFASLDPITPAENATRLASMLKTASAMVEHKNLLAAHGLTQADVTLAKAWFDER